MHEVTSQYSQGFQDYFKGIRYNRTGNNPEWLDGWTAAERQSRCGWFDQWGNPNGSINKAK
jgi:hypothetical protein